MPQPMSVRMAERASMDPYVCTDETDNHVGGKGVQTSVANTVHAAQIKIIKHRDASTLRDIWG